MGEVRLTNAEFAKMAARLAARSASWAGDVLELPKWRDRPVGVEALRRYVQDIREIVDDIERAIPAPSETGDAR